MCCMVVLCVFLLFMTHGAAVCIVSVLCCILYCYCIVCMELLRVLELHSVLHSAAVCIVIL